MKTLLIRAEDKNRWERRVPLVPEDLEQILAETGSRAYVEESEKRFFHSDAYLRVGAKICDSMVPGDVIVGVKEIPEEKILDNKVYLFFSHTIKGQKENMSMLKRIMKSGSTLIDYERITADDNRRIVYFGRYAGDAGAIDILALMGEYWAAHGIDTPLTQVKRAHEYASVSAAHAHLRTVGDNIREKGFPNKLAPFTGGVLGYGNVSGGAQQILDCLPNQRVEPGDIQALSDQNQFDTHTVYITVFKEEDLVENKSGKPFELNEYFRHPRRYQSRFTHYLPYYTLLINAIYWDKRYPRFVTWKGLEDLVKKEEVPKLNCIADITCDTHGSIECNVRSTDSDMPAYQVNPLTREVHDGHIGDGIVVLAVDNLPCELPRDSSVFFSSQLAPLVPNILQADICAPIEKSGLSQDVRKAVIVYKGKLTEDYQYLKEYL